MAHAHSAAAIVPVKSGCEWRPQVLPLPEGTVRGGVTAGDGEWFAGTASTADPADPEQGVLWHRGRLVPLGLAFGLDTHLHAVNPEGVAVGNVVDDNGTHAIRHGENGYEYLEETRGTSDAVDVNARGDVVGYDGPSTLVVWSADGTRRTLPMPPGEYPYGRPSIDDDGTVALWTGRVGAGGTFEGRGYAYAQDGTRTRLVPHHPGADVAVHDIKNGRIVGTAGDPENGTTAVAWQTTGSPTTTYPKGTEARAVNRSGLTVGKNPMGAPRVWSPTRAPSALPTPPTHTPGEVTTANDKEPGGYTFPRQGPGSTPVRWRCR
jgi:hypothetical protein